MVNNYTVENCMLKMLVCCGRKGFYCDRSPVQERDTYSHFFKSLAQGVVSCYMLANKDGEMACSAALFESSFFVVEIIDFWTAFLWIVFNVHLHTSQPGLD